VALVGAFANVALALVAVIIAFLVHRAETRRAERLVESDKRQRRASFAKDLIIWFEIGEKHLVIGGESHLHDPEWVRISRELEAASPLVDSPGTLDLMVAAKDARTELERVAVDDRMIAAISITRLLKLWAQQWVEDGHAGKYPVAQYVALSRSESTD
jgi:hypothetical protein